MVKVDFAPSDFHRRVSQAPDLLLRNRYFEKNPSLTDNGASLIARPGKRYLTTLGSGPIRGMFTEPGAFGGDLFVASGEELFRLSAALNAEVIASQLFNPDVGVVNMCAVQRIGANPEYLFAADGQTLRVYDGTTTTTVVTPDDVGIFDVATIASYVICLPVQEGEMIGRFYWIEPGETTIDPLNFATAESHPDALRGVEPFGDQFWLPGERSTEVWYPSGDPTAPMARLRGATIDRGAWEGTVVAINGTLILVDADGAVNASGGGPPEPISRPDIEEQIRKAISEQEARIFPGP